MKNSYLHTPMKSTVKSRLCLAEVLGHVAHLNRSDLIGCVILFQNGFDQTIYGTPQGSSHATDTSEKMGSLCLEQVSVQCNTEFALKVNSGYAGYLRDQLWLSTLERCPPYWEFSYRQLSECRAELASQ